MFDSYQPFADTPGPSRPPAAPLDFPLPTASISIRAAVWGAWRQRAGIALVLLRFALGLLLPVHLRRDRTGRYRLRPNTGATLHARGGDMHPEVAP